VPAPLSLPFDPIRRAAVLWERRWGRASAPQAMAAATSVMRTQQLLLATYDAVLAPYELSFPRFEALTLLEFSRDGRLPMTKLSRRLMVHPTSATHIIKRLAEQGFVARVPNPEDGRGTLAAITPAGRAVVADATTALVGAGFALDALTGAERVELFRLLEKVRRGARDFDDQVSAGER
jgi:DNA-binding MarR family transcriptional regulator